MLPAIMYCHGQKSEEIANKNTINSGKLMSEIVRIETLSEKTQAISPQDHSNPKWAEEGN